MTGHSPTSVLGSILLIDDHPELGQNLLNLLTNLGYTVRRVTDGQIATTAVQVALPDMILLNAALSSYNSYLLCQQLKQDPRTQAIPVIFTGAIDPAEISNLFHAGAADYLTMPLQPAELTIRVATHLELARLRQQVGQQAEQLHRLEHEHQQAEISLRSTHQRLQQEAQLRLTAETTLLELAEELQRLTSLDGLTQVAHRPQFDDCLLQEWRRLTRSQRPLSLILYQPRGNQPSSTESPLDNHTLRQIADILRTTVKRPTDLVARYTQNIFAVLLPNTPLAGAINVAQQIQSQLQQAQTEHAELALLTRSLGIANALPKIGQAPSQLIQAAEAALTEANSTGNDRIVTQDITPFPVLDYLITNQLGLE
ncbi:GGDEF domain-containing response regulator [Pantanalinema sp. GBBB05]|uniref:GGDEF domain-containing response regulator n=1 Tax=Pantanalinema sp. GBBB05 TaxID=2604139 RepID=UPI001DC9917B|nr:diguanylate cyclase [Pantanalinema sp. GBBB05]